MSDENEYDYNGYDEDDHMSVEGDGCDLECDEPNNFEFVVEDCNIEASNADNVEYIEGENSELMGKIVSSDEEAYTLYNDFSFLHGFGIRIGRIYRSEDKTRVTGREFVCHKNGLKVNRKGVGNKYNKSETRTKCLARLKFKVLRDGTYVVSIHDMIHNHQMAPPHLRHLIRSHREVGRQAIATVANLKASGVGVATSYRMLSKEAGGCENLGYTKEDLYNAMAAEKAIEMDGCDAKQLLSLLSEMQVKDKNYFYEIDVDAKGHIQSFFYRDGQMQRDFGIFGDVVVFDTTFNTNKWGMLLAPFIGINHHGRNMLFGIGFIPKENTGSLCWLFETFKKCMNGVSPKVIMTDQSAAIAKAVSLVFPVAKHRLCTWHIVENSKKHLSNYYGLEGFSDAFSYMLKYTDTKAEFHHYWNSLITTYDCADNAWLKNLYKLRNYWCPAYNKEVFSGGILSSQKCESTNNAAKKRVSKTDGLVDVYNILNDIVSEWREKERKEDYKTINGNIHMGLAEVPLCMHAREIYTQEIYVEFEQEFMNSDSCCQKLISCDNGVTLYYVWRRKYDVIKHQVLFNEETHLADCFVG